MKRRPKKVRLKTIGKSEEENKVSAWKRATIFVSVICCIVLSASPAVAGFAYHGNDFSYTYGGNRNFAVCDQERDSHRVLGRFGTNAGYTYQISDQNGAGGDCGYAEGFSSGISFHRTCEDYNFKPIECGGVSRH